MPEKRKRLIRLIHVAKRELNLDDPTYRAILRGVVNADSAADLDASKLQKVLDHLKVCGFKVRPNKKFSRKLAQDPRSKKIRALWLFLHEIDVVRDTSERALAMYVKRIAKVDALQWLTPEQAYLVIESLKKWAMRYLPDKNAQLYDHVLTLDIPGALRNRLLQFPKISSYDDNVEFWGLLHQIKTKYPE